MPVGEFDKSDDRFNYEDELKDDEDTISFGKYKGLTPFEVLQRDPGYITWATAAFPQGWVGSQRIIDAAALKVPSQAIHAKRKAVIKSDSNKAYLSDAALIRSFEECMLDNFGEFPTPAWKLHT